MKSAWIVVALLLLFAIVEADPVRDLMSGNPDLREAAADLIRESSDKAWIPSVIEIAFYYTVRKDSDGLEEISRLLQSITGEKRHKYFEWLQWIGAHPEIPHKPDYLALKREILSTIDPAFGEFLKDEQSLRIRPEEIVWGGVRTDGIPALIQPRYVSVLEAGYLKQSDRVFGIYVNGKARAYPLRILDWHEMVNDTIEGIPIVIPYCTLCGSAVLYDPTIEGKTYTFGSSGLLYRSNKLMYDHQTRSLWSALSGEPVAGPLASSGIQLQVHPIVRTRWGEWIRRHPDTTVLSTETGFSRDYTVEPYKEYFESNKVMFPVPIHNEKLAPKDFVFALRLGKLRKAYPLDTLIAAGMLTDSIGGTMVALVSDPEGKSVRAYECPSAPAKDWTAAEDSMISTDGKAQCKRLPGHLAYWFGWYAQFPDTELYIADDRPDARFRN